MKVVVVESPAKAKTINKYLGADYRVLASFGHVRDLPPKDGSVRPEADFAMTWETEGRGAKQIQEIAAAAKDAETLILATDPDREGEAISWHIAEILRGKKGFAKLPIERVAFNEVTKPAIVAAMAKPRSIDQELVDAYLARRALDYLVGFTLSPVLWRKLPGSRSAGRVQSVALRLICEREAEIEAFRPRDYWSVEGEFRTETGQSLTARLTHLDGRKLDRFDLPDAAAAQAAIAAIRAAAPFRVGAVERKSLRRHPFPPFTTSTLQQEASRKLGLGAAQTMRIAQRLYEGIDLDGETVGIITYMRTDGVALSQEAIASSRHLIEAQFGARYLPAKPRVYKSAAKNAQEAHEAIRPTDLNRRPAAIKRYLREEEFRLYELIWKRTLAAQMESAEIDQVGIDIIGAKPGPRLRASGSVVLFDGFLALYQEDRDDPLEGEEDTARRLPDLKDGQTLDAETLRPEHHVTQPPPRYSEASLIKRLEELGIGRPSTYTSILQTLEDRDYVKLEKRRLIPEDRGRLVTAFLTSFFKRYVEYDFTADLEGKLDDISGGRARWRDVLADFWRDFSRLHRSEGADDSTNLASMSDAVGFLDQGIGSRSVVIDALNDALGPHFFPDRGDGHNPRLCPSCAKGELGIRLAKTGAFIGCGNYPECRYTRPLAVDRGGESATEAALAAAPQILGKSRNDGKTVSLRKGPYGFYVQADEDAPAKKGEKPKRVSLPKTLAPDQVTLEIAERLLELPRTIGTHPESGQPILAGIGRFGPYLHHDGKYRSLPAGEDVLTIGMNRAVEILAQPRTGGRGGRNLPVGKEIGRHPETGESVTLHDGRYGRYVKLGKINATLPKDMAEAEIDLDAALALIAQRIAKGGGKPARKTAAPRKKAATAKTAKRKKPAG